MTVGTRGRAPARREQGTASVRAGGFADQARGLVRAVVEGFRENDLLTYASAISWQMLFALVPLSLAGLALLGFLSLEEVWQRDLAPRVRENVSGAAFTVIDATVERILGAKRGFWLTLGLALAIWQVSGAVRAAMGVLTRVYGGEETRSFWKRIALSLGLAVAISALLGLAVAVVQLGPRVISRVGGGLAVDVAGVVLRYGLAVFLLLVLVWVILRFAPAVRRSVSWVSGSAVAIVCAWTVASVVFGWYAREVASYRSVFGSLAVAIVLMTYLSITAIVFLVGVQLDAIARRRLADDGDGARKGEQRPGDR